MALARDRPVGVVIIAGSPTDSQRGIPLGIDFSGGTIVVVKFEQPVTEDQVRNALVAAVPGEQVIQSYGDPAAEPEADPPAAAGRRKKAPRSSRTRERSSMR